jgi:hypothetical protein
METMEATEADGPLSSMISDDVPDLKMVDFP